MAKTKEEILDELNKESRGRYKVGPKEMAVIKISKELENPVEGGVALPRGEKGVPNVHGAFSIETFCKAGALQNTHEDRYGWQHYLEKWHPRNFWYADGGVKPWAYYETYDNWQETYGMDAVLAVYHAGHGRMDGNGRFYAAMGADWGGLGGPYCEASSDPSQMGIGNEKVRYVFWSTCVSLRVLQGHTPIRTWSPVHKGFRMLFGFETTSTDSPDYGKNFWNEWNKGKSLSYAWLDASWSISHHQAPSVVACGATPAEASDRLFNEKLLQWGAVSGAYWHWMWYYVAAALREPNLKTPTELLSAKLEPVDLSARNISTVIDNLNIKAEVPESISAESNVTLSGEDDLQIAFGRDGSYEMQLTKPDRDNKEQISSSIAKSKASDAVSRFGLGRGVSLVQDSIRVEAEGGSNKDATKIEGPYTTQTTVQFNQLINDLPVLNQDVGKVRVSLDNDGSVTSLQSFVRKVATLTDKPRKTTEEPLEGGVSEQPQAKTEIEYDRLLAKGVQKLLWSLAVRGAMPVQYRALPGLTEIGYEIKENKASLAARKAIEVDFGGGYLKNYWVVVPL